MKSNLSYAGLMDAEILKRFFEGKLSSEENDYFTTLLADDELLREAFAGLSSESFDVVQSISQSTNSKINKMMGKAPLVQRWTFWLSIFIGVMLISFTAYQFLPEGGEKNVVASTSVSENEKGKESKKVEEDKIAEDKKESESNDNTLGFENSSNSTLSMELMKKNNSNNDVVIKVDDVKSNEVMDQNQNDVADGPEDKKIVDNKVVNTNTNDAPVIVVKKKTRLRLSDANVLQSLNLYEKEASVSTRPNDPTNPNIGTSVTTKKSNGFNLEDMPKYPGGAEALNSYVKGRLATKSYASDQKGVSTIVEFVVTSKGRVEDVKLQNKVDAALEKDIIEVISNLEFLPGKKSGKKGSMYYSMALVYN